MARVRVHDFSISIDGYAAGPNQSTKDPLGVGGECLHEWFIHTRTFKRTHGGEGGSTGVDDDVAARGASGIGAWIMGRKMFGPVRGPWPDQFHFVTDGIETALERARGAAGGKDVRLAGGAATTRQYFRARLVDEMHLAVAPILLGSGESLLADLDLPALGYRGTEHIASDKATRYVIVRAG